MPKFRPKRHSTRVKAPINPTAVALAVATRRGMPKGSPPPRGFAEMRRRNSPRDRPERIEAAAKFDAAGVADPQVRSSGRFRYDPSNSDRPIAAAGRQRMGGKTGGVRRI